MCSQPTRCCSGAEPRVVSAARRAGATVIRRHRHQTLTALDYFEIQQLVAKYARAIDTCSNNGYDYADLFAPDGYFAPEQNGKVGNKAQGRERLAEISGGGSRGCKNVGWIRQGVKHLYVNHIITPTATGATGTRGHADDRVGWRSQQDPPRRLLRGYLRQDAQRAGASRRGSITCLRVGPRDSRRAGADKRYPRRTRAPAVPAPQR